MAFDSQTLRTAVPYIQKFKGEIFVVKLGGDLCEPLSRLEPVLEQVVVLHQLGVRIVLVHGGGKQIEKLSEKLGIQTEKIDGRRVTSKDTLETVKMSLSGVITTDILALLKKLRANAVGLSGVDSALITAERRPPRKDSSGAEIQFGEVGDIVEINTSIIDDLFEHERIPVVASLGCSERGEVLNINADTVASSLAVALRARKLVFLLNTPGVLREQKDPSSLISVIESSEVEDLIKNKIISGGMLPKVTAGLHALEQGVRRVHLVSGLTQDALLKEIFTNEGSGTLLTSSSGRVATSSALH